MNIYKYELSAYRNSTIIWSGSIVTLVALMISIYPSFMKDVEQLKQLLSSLPEVILQAFSIHLDAFTSILGFYSYIFTYVLLCGAVQAMNLGLSIISKEVREKTADFLLSKPISRQTIMTAKLLAAITSIVLTNIVYLLTSSIVISMIAQSEFNHRSLLFISLSLLFIQLIFFALGIIISVIVPKIRSVLPLSLGIVFGFFIVGLFSSAIGDAALRYLTPFKYFDAHYIMQHASYEMPYLLVGIGIVVVSIVASYIIYVKKDIHVG